MKTDYYRYSNCYDLVIAGNIFDSAIVDSSRNSDNKLLQAIEEQNCFKAFGFLKSSRFRMKFHLPFVLMYCIITLNVI